MRRTNKRPEILADLITGSTNPGTFNRSLRKVVFRCFGTLRSFKILVWSYVRIRTALVDSPWSIRTGSHLIDAGLLLGPHRSND